MRFTWVQLVPLPVQPGWQVHFPAVLLPEAVQSAFASHACSASQLPSAEQVCCPPALQRVAPGVHAAHVPFEQLLAPAWPAFASDAPAAPGSESVAPPPASATESSPAADTEPPELFGLPPGE
jgi:hypothetical protein